MPADEEPAGPLPDLGGFLRGRGTVLTSPARRCRVPGAAVDDRLRPWDLGTWTGQPYAGLDLAAWRADPAYDAHGGESLLALSARVAALLADLHGKGGRLAAVTHGPLVKAAVVQALRAPVEAVWDLDVAPASVTELHATPTGWRVTRVGA